MVLYFALLNASARSQVLPTADRRLSVAAG